MTVKLSDTFSSPFHHERALELTSDIGEIKDFFDNQEFYAEVFRKVASVDVKAIKLMVRYSLPTRPKSSEIPYRSIQLPSR